MSGYNTPLQVYYCKQSEIPPGSKHRIAPAPQIKISPEIYYANDNVIGYTYNITLSGYANALRKENDAGSVSYGLSGVVDHMGDIREIFNTNGGNLYIKQGSDDLLVAKGATIKKIDYSESDNRWVNYSPFTIELEFNEIDLIGCAGSGLIPCDSGIFHQTAGHISDNLIDIKKHKIKEFSDKWTFTIDDQIYDTYVPTQTYNNTFKVNYNLSATGKNYYVNDKLVPAWQQARLFVQDRLYKQVFSLINGHLSINGDDACGASSDITTIHAVDIIPPRESGIFQNFDTIRDGVVPTYDVYNEVITCDSSESDGSFSINYEAILKKYNPEISPLANAAIHTFSKDISTSTSQNIEATINVKGTVQGLVRGGFIQYNNDFILPQSGTLITNVDSKETKYDNAYQYYQTKVGSKTDLKDSVKELLNIKKSQLLIRGDDGYPLPSNFTIDHNYHTGSVSYSATYDRSLASLDKGFTSISIVRQDPVDIIQEFIIPGRIQGPIIQKLNMKTARTVSVTIEGASPDNKKCSIDDVCNNLPFINIKNFSNLLEENNSWLKTKEDYTVNPIDGSFSISLEYTVRSC